MSKPSEISPMNLSEKPTENKKVAKQIKNRSIGHYILGKKTS